MAVALALVAGCRSKHKRRDDASAETKPTPSANTAPAAVAAPAVEALPPGIGEPAASAPHSTGLVMKLRAALSQSTPEDGLRLVVGWSHPSDLRSPPGFTNGYDSGSELGLSEVDWRATLASMHFAVTSPAGEVHDVGGIVTSAGREPLGVRPSMTLHMEGTKVFLGRFETTMEKPAPNLVPGVYRVSAAATLVIGKQTMSFTTPAVPIVVRPASPAFLTVAALEEKARAALLARVKSEHPELDHGQGIERSSTVLENAVDEPTGTRRVLYRDELYSWGDGGHAQVVRVRMSPAGELVDFTTGTESQCVVEGTAIATPAGETLVEALRTGDIVWGYDLESESLVRAKVEAIRRSTTSQVFSLGEGGFTAAGFADFEAHVVALVKKLSGGAVLTIPAK